MDAVSYDTAKMKLGETMDSVCRNHAPVIVIRPDEPAVVFISLEDYNSIQETAYLLGTPANASRLRHSVADAEAGRTTRVTLDAL